MRPEVADALIELPFEVLAHLSHLGVEVFSDVVGLFPHCDGFLDMIKSVRGASVPSDLNLAACTIYAKVARLARQDRADAVAQLVAQRESVYPSGVAAPLDGQVPPPGPANRLRRLIPNSGGDLMTTLSDGANPAAHSKEEAAKQAKLDLMFQILIEYVLAPSDIGMTAQDMADPVNRRTVRDLVLQAASRLSVPRLGSLVNSFRRWVRFCKEREWPPADPKPFQVASFLQHVSKGGPTAGASMYAALKWFSTQAGASFPMDHHLVSPYKFHAVTHTSRQAPELQPWEFINLLFLAGRALGSHKILLSWMIMAATSCIRWEHVQRSTFVAKHKAWLEFRCSQGKSRRQGARPAYEWAMPLVRWQGMCVNSLLADFYKNEMLPASEFLIPALQLSAEELWDVCESTPFILQRKMSRGRFLETFRGALLDLIRRRPGPRPSTGSVVSSRHWGLSSKSTTPSSKPLATGPRLSRAAVETDTRAGPSGSWATTTGAARPFAVPK